MKAWARVDVDSSEHLRRRVERRACPVRLALLHVTVSDIEGLNRHSFVGGRGRGGARRGVDRLGQVAKVRAGWLSDGQERLADVM